VIDFYASKLLDLLLAKMERPVMLVGVGISNLIKRNKVIEQMNINNVEIKLPRTEEIVRKINVSFDHNIINIASKAKLKTKKKKSDIEDVY
jgi:flagellin-specific chaperone FliS